LVHDHPLRHAHESFAPKNPGSLETRLSIGLSITAGGKYIVLSTIEGVITFSKYINQICIIDDKRKEKGRILKDMISIIARSYYTICETGDSSYLRGCWRFQFRLYF
jgi:hypothetical protein